VIVKITKVVLSPKILRGLYILEFAVYNHDKLRIAITYESVSY
jgi:hypothetical protein